MLAIWPSLDRFAQAAALAAEAAAEEEAVVEVDADELLEELLLDAEPELFWTSVALVKAGSGSNQGAWRLVNLIPLLNIDE